MKYIKRFVSVLLALCMIFAVATTTFAAGGGSITVDNPQNGQTYTAYKIFDVIYNTDKSAYSYSIDGDSEWFAVVNSYSGLTLTKAVLGNRYVVEKNENFSAAGFANTLKAAVAGKNGTPLTTQGDVASATGLELGYYFVSSTSGALCNLTTTNPSATIHDKNDVPFEKTDNKADVEVGEVVNYTIKGKVPDTTGFTTYEYTIKDTMSEGLTFNKDVKVLVDGNELGTENYTITLADNGFDLTIKVMELQDKVGKDIRVTYTATVNEKAVAQVSKNSATLTYSNDPTQSNKTETTPADEETVYSAKIVIDKYVKDKANVKLAGAKFVLKNEEGKYYKYIPSSDNSSAKVEWIEDKAQATEVTTDTDGAADFKGLKNGEYSIIETAAPAGYNMLTKPVAVTIQNNDSQTISTADLIKEIGVANSTGTTLPETGGIGTTLFYVFGGLLVVGAAVLLITKKRMNTKK